ncbi:MAG: hypothetical protein ABJN40_13580 [Sneathiella sp.]
MRRIIGVSLMVAAAFFLQGCQTTGTGKLPEGALSEKAGAAYRSYRYSGGFKAFKAFVISPDGQKWASSWTHFTPDDAIDSALKLCPDTRGCRLYAIGDTIVFHDTSAEKERITEAYKRQFAPDRAEDVLKNHKRLKSRDILEILSENSTFEGETFSTQEFSLNFDQDNKIRFKLLDIRAAVKKGDHGTWWMAGDSLCQRFKVYYAAKPQCYSVYRQGNELALANRNGEVIATMEAVKPIADGSKIQKKASVKKTQLITSWALLPEKHQKSIGLMVGYSELCEEFNGTTMPRQDVADIKRFFSGSNQFENGYRAQASLIGSDFVTGLDRCDEINDRLETLNESLGKVSVN